MLRRILTQMWNKKRIGLLACLRNKKSKNIRLTKAVRNCCGGLTSETQKKEFDN